MSDVKTYLYSVNPRRTITGLSNVNNFRVPKSLFLTLEDVEICLKNATVHRRFANEDRIEKVTIDNYKRLHNDVFMTEEEYEQFLKNELSKDSSTVTEPSGDPDSLPDDNGEKTDETPAENVGESVPDKEKENGKKESEDNPDEVAPVNNSTLDEEIYPSDDEDEVSKEEVAEGSEEKENGAAEE